MFYSKMLNNLFNNVNWENPRRITDNIIDLYYKQSDCNFETNAKDMLSVLSSDNIFPLFVETMNKLKCSILYKSHIHGQSHIERVSILSFALALQLQLNSHDLELCLEIAKYHDIGRRDEGEDEEHGMRGAEKFMAICDEFSNNDKNIIAMVIAAHSLRDDCYINLFKQWKGLEEAQYIRCKILLDIIKDADALDRFRLRDKSLKIDFLRLGYSTELVRVACEMVHAFD